jgi:hypothetical protein
MRPASDLAPRQRSRPPPATAPAAAWTGLPPLPVLDPAQQRGHLDDFVAAYNFGRRLKTLKGLTPYEYVCKIWTTEPK